MRCVRVVRFMLGLLLAALPVRGETGLEQRVAEVLAEPGYQHAHWGLLVVERDSGAVVFEENADQLFRPASVTKLYSGGAALVGLGAEYRFQTPVKRTAEIDKEGRLSGELILVASGDPCLGGRTGPEGNLLFRDHDHSYASGTLDTELVSDDPLAPLAGLDSLAREVAAAGIKSVEDVIVDDRLFEAAPSTGSGPKKVAPIIINDNVIDIVVTPGTAAGEPAPVRIVPPTSFVTMDARVETAPEGTTPSLEVVSIDPNRFQVRGRLPVGHRPVVRIFEVAEPAEFARALFIETLLRRGVRVTASPLGRNATERLPSRAEVAALPKTAQYTSPPFSEYLKVTLKVSQNLHASTLPLLLAVQSGGRTLEAGLRREGELLKGLGVDIESISFGGGAGGSPADLTTPRATVELLRALAKRPDIAVFEAALPVLGRDGTLVEAVGEESPARGHVRAKTGTYYVENRLNGEAILTSKALAGYMDTASGRALVFAFFVNGAPLDVPVRDASQAARAAGRLLGRLCEVFHADTPESASDEAKKPDQPAQPASQPTSQPDAGG